MLILIEGNSGMTRRGRSHLFDQLPASKLQRRWGLISEDCCDVNREAKKELILEAQFGPRHHTLGERAIACSLQSVEAGADSMLPPVRCQSNVRHDGQERHKWSLRPRQTLIQLRMSNFRCDAPDVETATPLRFNTSTYKEW